LATQWIACLHREKAPVRWALSLCCVSIHGCDCVCNGAGEACLHIDQSYPLWLNGDAYCCGKHLRILRPPGTTAVLAKIAPGDLRIFWDFPIHRLAMDCAADQQHPGWPGFVIDRQGDKNVPSSLNLNSTDIKIVGIHVTAAPSPCSTYGGLGRGSELSIKKPISSPLAIQW
jgi:hypothetical protein